MLDEYVDALLYDAIRAKTPEVAAVIEGSARYTDALSAVEEAQKAHDDSRDSLEMQEELGMDGYLAGLRVRKDAVQVARDELTAARKTSAPDWWQGKRGGTKITLEQFMERDERERFARFVDRIILHSVGGPGARVPLHARTEVYWVDAEQAA